MSAIKESQSEGLPVDTRDAPAMPTTRPAKPAPVPGLRIFQPGAMAAAMDVGRALAEARGILPRDFEGDHGVATAIAIQALSWNLDPIALARYAYRLPESGKLGFEAKAVGAALVALGYLRREPDFEKVGDWSGINGVPVKKVAGARGGDKTVRGWDDKAEAGVGLRVVFPMCDGRDVGLTVMLSEIGVRNSPLWATNPETMLSYQAVQRFARTRAPGVLFGVRMPGESEEQIAAREARESIDITPQKKLETLLAPSKARLTGDESSINVTEAFGRIQRATTPQEMEQVGRDIAGMPDGTRKETLRSAYKFRLAELKGKAAPVTDVEPHREPDPAPEPKPEPEPQAEAEAEPDPDATESAAGAPPAATYEQVKRQLTNAATLDELGAAADLIGAVESPDHREDLVDLYRELAARHD
jgi:hypothetical protein